MAFALSNPQNQFFDDSGSPLASGTIEFRNPTSDALINTYPTADDADAQTNANDNPLELNSRGEAPTGIYLEDGVKYKIILKDADGATVWNQDDVRTPLYSAESIGEALNVRTQAEIDAGVTPTNHVYLDIRRYGAAIDGATDDTTAIKNAILVSENGGGPVVLPTGQIYVATLTTFDAGLFDGVFEVGSDVWIKGSGPDTVFVGSKSEGTDANGYALFVVRGGDDIRFSGFVVDGGDRTTSKGLGSAIVCRPSASTDIEIDRVHCRNMRSTGISVGQISDSGEIPLVERCIITNCILNSINGHGIAVKGCRKVVVSNIIAEDCIAATFSSLAVDISEGCQDVAVSNIVANNCEAGIKAESVPSTSFASSRVVFSNVIIQGGADTVTYGLRVAAEHVSLSNVQIHDVKDYGINIAVSDNTTATFSGLIVDGVTAGSSDTGRPFRLINTGESASTFIEKDRFSFDGSCIFSNCADSATLRSSGVKFTGTKFDTITDGLWAVEIPNSSNSDGTNTYDDIEFIGCAFEDCLAVDVDKKTVSTVDYGTKNFTFVGNRVTVTLASSNHAVQIDTGQGLTIGCNNIEALASSTNTVDAISLTNCQQFQIGLNRLNADRYGVSLFGDGSNALDNGTIIGNTIKAGLKTVRAPAATTVANVQVAFNADVDGVGEDLSSATGFRETWSITNGTTDRAFDADTVAVAELADAFGTLVSDLQGRGVI